MNKSRLAIGLALMVASACSDVVTAELEGAPEPPVLGIDSLVVGSLSYSCRRWNVEPSRSSLMMLDLYFWRGLGDSDRAPRADHIAALERENGRIVSSLHFPAVRAVVSADAVERLAEMQVVNYARAVPYSDRHDVKILVQFTGGSEQDWTGIIEGLGGSVDLMIGGLLIVSAVLPDDRATELRAHPSVSIVEVNGLGCLAE